MPRDAQAYADVLVMAIKTALAPVQASVSSLTEKVAGFETAWSDVGALRERVAVLETRAQVPGPAGVDGKDGADGLGFDDLDVEFDDERTVQFKFTRGDVQKSWPVEFPFMRYHGVFADGLTYEKGDVVTWGGSTWHANEQTATKPGDGSKAWTLVVKRGRDGRDGKDGAAGVPVVKV